MYLQDRVLVVSGVGPDLGRQIAVRGAAAGADVVLAARTASRLEDVAAEIKELGRRALVVPTDITVQADAERLATAAIEEFGKVDALVHNALVMPPIADLGKVDLDAVLAGFNNNVISALRMTRLFIPALAATSGSVVMVNSMVVRFSQRTMGPYKMAKASLLAMAQSLATELGPQGIRVNSVAPGHIWGESLSGTSTTSQRSEAWTRTTSTPRPRRTSTWAGCRSRTRSPTLCCSSRRRWRVPSRVSAST
jgi:NAD(P)-dependent dehydrogenase (short-subunit alcohol dehydrogenase family)